MFNACYIFKNHFNPTKASQALSSQTSAGLNSAQGIVEWNPRPLLYKCSMFAQMLLIILIHPQARCLMGWIKPKATISFSFNFLTFKSNSLNVQCLSKCC